MSRLLLVDDNPSINRIVESLLSGTPTEVTYAQTASEALGLIDGEPPFDVAMLDASLPEMDGWELLGRMRENPKSANIPIAMMVGVLEDVDHAKAESASIQALMLKPVDFRDLPDKVQELIAVGTTARVAPSVVPVASASFADTDLLILEEQDLAEDEELGELGADAPLSPLVSDPGSDGDAMFSLNLEDLNMGEIEKLATDGESALVAEPVAEDAEPFIPLPVLEPETGPHREDTSDFIDTTPEDFDFGQADQVDQVGSGIDSVAAQEPEAVAGDVGAVSDMPYAATEADAADGRQLDAAPLGQGEYDAPVPVSDVPPDVVPDVAADGSDGSDGPGPSGDFGPLASTLESELLSDEKFIEAVARAVTKAVADKLSH